MPHGNGIFWDRFLKTPLEVYEKTPLEARNRISGDEPPRFSALVLVYIDEANPVYYPDGDVQFNLDLDAYIDWFGTFTEEQQELILFPMINRVESTSDPGDDEDVGGIIPSAEPFPQTHFDQHGLIGRSEGVSNYTFIPQFETRFNRHVRNNLDDDFGRIITMHFLIDHSGSMDGSSLEPGLLIPDHNGESVQQILLARGFAVEYAAFNTERWINEVLTYLQGSP